MQCVTYGATADLVARQGRILWVIELKRSLNFDVIAQADFWHGRAHYTSVATPHTRAHPRGRALAMRVLDWKGIGYLPIHAPHSGCEASVAAGIVQRGSLNRRACSEVLHGSLTEEQKTFAQAGNAEGKRWTPFQRTCREVRECVAKEPGIHLKKLVDSINHHYASDASARSSLSTLIRGGQVEGVEARIEGRYLRIYPA